MKVRTPADLGLLASREGGSLPVVSMKVPLSGRDIVNCMSTYHVQFRWAGSPNLHIEAPE